jgi:hypothetical protein
MTISKNSNSVWDLEISFFASKNVSAGPAPIRLVTNERLILRAADLAECGECATTLDVHRASL